MMTSIPPAVDNSASRPHIVNTAGRPTRIFHSQSHTLTIGGNMAKQHVVSVSKKDFPKFEVNVELPESLEDEKWNDIVKDPSSDIHDLALRSWIVNMQSGARGQLDADATDEENQAAVQNYADNYVLGVRTGGFSKPKLSTDKASELSFTPEQLAALKAIGVDVAA